MPWNFQGGPTPRRPSKNCRQIGKCPPAFLLVMIDQSEAPGRRARGNIEQHVYREGQFDVRSESAGPSPASEMTPRVAVLSSSTSMASSKDDCHDPFTIVAASA